jgi:hypothetical protein
MPLRQFDNLTTIPQRQKPDEDSGVVSIIGDKILWHNEDIVFAAMNLSDIAITGEYTNDSGPWFDDWFITLVGKNGEWINIPWYANGIDELTKVLSEKFEAGLNISSLANSAVWKSIVRFPESLKDKPLFILVPSVYYKEPKTFFDRILYAMGLGKFNTTKQKELSNDVKEFLKQK